MPLTQNPSDKYVAALAQLMQNYRSGSAVSGQCQIVPIQDPSTSRNGLASIGTDGHVYLIMPDSSSDTGWTCTDTQCPLPNVKSVGGSGSASGVMLIATDGESLQQYSSGTWQALTPPSSVTLNGVAELRTTIIPGSRAVQFSEIPMILRIRLRSRAARHRVFRTLSPPLARMML